MPKTFSTFNQRAATASSVLAAIAVVLAAVITVLELGNQSVSAVPTGPRDLPFSADAGSPGQLALVSFENESIQQRAEIALSQINYDWETNLEGWSIQFLTPVGRASGYTWTEHRRIEVFVKDDADQARIRRILAHELGHAVDVTLNTGDERREWLAQRAGQGTPPQEIPPQEIPPQEIPPQEIPPQEIPPQEIPWWPSSAAPDFETGAGDFAEVFAAWEVGIDDYRSTVAPVPSDADFALLERLSQG